MNWNPISQLPQAGWSSVAIDGQNMLACYVSNVDGDGFVYLSTDSGSTWNPISQLPQAPWSSVAIDGQNMLTCNLSFGDENNFVYLSTDSGLNWNPISQLPQAYWSSVAIDGQNMLACNLSFGVGNGFVHLSTDSGLTWNPISQLPQADWSSVAIDGQNMLACSTLEGGDGFVYLSTDSGLTWNPISQLPQANWRSVAIDGQNMLACYNYNPVGNGFVYLSTDSGSTWNPISQLPQTFWNSVAVNQNFFLAAASDYVYISYYAPCLISGTKILTETGYKNIEDINENTKIIGCFSQQPQVVKKVIKTIVNENCIENTNRPVTIKKSSISEHIPSEDVHISGHHRIIIKNDDKNYIGIQAFKLIENFTDFSIIKKAIGKNEIVYYNLQLEDSTEGLIISGGLAVESYQSN